MATRRRAAAASPTRDGPASAGSEAKRARAADTAGPQAPPAPPLGLTPYTKLPSQMLTRNVTLLVRRPTYLRPSTACGRADRGCAFYAAHASCSWWARRALESKRWASSCSRRLNSGRCASTCTVLGPFAALVDVARERLTRPSVLYRAAFPLFQTNGSAAAAPAGPVQPAAADRRGGVSGQPDLRALPGAAARQLGCRRPRLPARTRVHRRHARCGGPHDGQNRRVFRSTRLILPLRQFSLVWPLLPDAQRTMWRRTPLSRPSWSSCPLTLSCLSFTATWPKPCLAARRRSTSCRWDCWRAGRRQGSARCCCGRP